MRPLHGLEMLGQQTSSDRVQSRKNDDIKCTVSKAWNLAYCTILVYSYSYQKQNMGKGRIMSEKLSLYSSAGTVGIVLYLKVFVIVAR